MARRTRTAKFREFFPPDHPNTPWLLRLAILRDDLRFELSPIVAPSKAEPTADDAWIRTYAFRRLSVTIWEIQRVFSQPHVGRAIKKALPREQVGRMKGVFTRVQVAADFLKAIRNSIGGHVDFDDGAVPGFVDAHGDTVMQLHLDDHRGAETSLRALTLATFVFPWPDVKTQEDFNAKAAEAAEKVMPVCVDLLMAIDFLFHLHWSSLGIEPEPGTSQAAEPRVAVAVRRASRARRAGS